MRPDAATLDPGPPSTVEPADPSDDLTHSFVRLSNLPTYPLDRLSRYEADALASGLSDLVCAPLLGSTKAVGNTENSSAPRWPVRSLKLSSDDGHRADTTIVV
jgi:hypothetical protein